MNQVEEFNLYEDTLLLASHTYTLNPCDMPFYLDWRKNGEFQSTIID
jgi:hypothetical protein